MDASFLNIDKKIFSYQFIQHPFTLSYPIVQKKLEQLAGFKSIKSRPDRDKILQELSSLVETINTQSQELKDLSLKCIGCSNEFHHSTISNLNYINCTRADCRTIASLKNGKLKLEVNNPDLQDIAQHDWGMDYIEIDA
jgi:hypothetical protein